MLSRQPPAPSLTVPFLRITESQPKQAGVTLLSFFPRRCTEQSSPPSDAVTHRRGAEGGRDFRLGSEKGHPEKSNVEEIFNSSTQRSPCKMKINIKKKNPVPFLNMNFIPLQIQHSLLAAQPPPRAKATTQREKHELNIPKHLEQGLFSCGKASLAASGFHI